MTLKKKKNKVIFSLASSWRVFVTFRILLRGARLLSQSVSLILGHQFHCCVFYHF